jgi:hypothetical protein
MPIHPDLRAASSRQAVGASEKKVRENAIFVLPFWGRMDKTSPQVVAVVSRPQRVRNTKSYRVKEQQLL